MRATKYGSLLLVLIAVGCSGDKPKLTMNATVGRVLYNGVPAAGVLVYLMPTGAPMVPEIPNNPHGRTGTDGRFAIGTFALSDGAAAGGYQIVLLWLSEAGSTRDSEDSAEDRLYGWYSPVQSTLSCQIGPGNNEIPVLNLPIRNSAPPISNGVPGRN